MGYTKTISYSNVIEIHEYEKDIRHSGRKGRRLSISSASARLGQVGEDMLIEGKQKPKKRPANARRSSVVFRRLVSANLDQSDPPLLISLTYAENIESLDQGHRDFNTFARAVRDQFGNDAKYIAVPEFQRRGAVHFHALFWGLPTKELASTERNTRLFQSLWGKGFVDLVATDGDHKIAGYLSKYMAKAFLDERLYGKKAYIASRNIKRPVVDKNAFLFPLF